MLEVEGCDLAAKEVTLAVPLLLSLSSTEI